MNKLAKRFVMTLLPLMQAFNASAVEPPKKKREVNVEASRSLVEYLEMKKIAPAFAKSANGKDVLYPFDFIPKDGMKKGCPFHKHEDVYGQVMPKLAMSQVLSRLPTLEDKPLLLFYGSTTENPNPIAHGNDNTRVPDVYFIAQDYNCNGKIEANELLFRLQQNSTFTELRHLQDCETMDDYFFKGGKEILYTVTYLPKNKKLTSQPVSCAHGELRRKPNDQTPAQAQGVLAEAGKKDDEAPALQEANYTAFTDDKHGMRFAPPVTTNPGINTVRYKAPGVK
jgi:hypothetical protein